MPEQPRTEQDLEPHRSARERERDEAVRKAGGEALRRTFVKETLGDDAAEVSVDLTAATAATVLVATATLLLAATAAFLFVEFFVDLVNTNIARDAEGNLQSSPVSWASPGVIVTIVGLAVPLALALMRRHRRRVSRNNVTIRFTPLAVVVSRPGMPVVSLSPASVLFEPCARESRDQYMQTRLWHFGRIRGDGQAIDLGLPYGDKQDAQDLCARLTFLLNCAKAGRPYRDAADEGVRPAQP